MKKKYNTEEEKREAQRLRTKKYRNEHPDKCKKLVEDWQKAHPEAMKSHQRKRYAKMKREQPEQLKQCRKDRWTKLSRARRLILRIAFNLSKCLARPISTTDAIEFTGCTGEELMSKITTLLQPGMSWDNYGSWHIDHIIPKKTIKLAEDKEAQARAVFHYSNLQPLWAHENIAKQ